MLYFDHNATHPLSRAAREAWLDAVERFPGNPSSPHRLGARAEAALDQARERLAGWLGCDPTEIVWTSGATESNNMVLHQAAAGTAGEVIVSAIEHPSVLETARRSRVGRHRLIPATPEGTIDLSWLADALKSQVPALVALMAANNETGALQPWRETLALCRDRKVPFFCDAAQWIGKLPALRLGECDFVSGCAHKFGGPQGVGFLKCPPRTKPLLIGGLQEGGRRAGTENVAGILAMVAALAEREYAMSRGEFSQKAEAKAHFENALLGTVPGTEIVASAADRLWNTTSAVMPELPERQQRWVVKLDKLGFAISTGSACASGKEKPSHVLAAIGLTPQTASRVLRFSAGWDTAPADWQGLLGALKRAFIT